MDINEALQIASESGVTIVKLLADYENRFLELYQHLGVQRNVDPSGNNLGRIRSETPPDATQPA